MPMSMREAFPCDVAGQNGTKRRRKAIRLFAIAARGESSRSSHLHEDECVVTGGGALPLRYEAEFDSGPYRAVKDAFKIQQAIMRFSLNEGWALITRTNFPLEVQPPKKPGEHCTFGGQSGGAGGTDSLLLSPIASYHFGEGWSLGTSPNISSNWLAKPGEQWTVPIGGGVSKTFRDGAAGIKLSLAAYYNAIRPQASNDTWLAQFTLTFVIPK